MATYFEDAGYTPEMIFEYKGENPWLHNAYLVLLIDNGTASPVFTVCREFTDNALGSAMEGLPFSVNISDVRPVNWPWPDQAKTEPRRRAYVDYSFDADKEHMRTCLIMALTLIERMPSIDPRPDQRVLRESLEALDPWQHFDNSEDDYE